MAIKHVRKHGVGSCVRIIGILGVVVGLGGSALAADLPPSPPPARAGGLRSRGAAGLQLRRRLCRHQRRLGLGQWQIHGERRRHISGHDRLS